MTDIFRLVPRLQHVQSRSRPRRNARAAREEQFSGGQRQLTAIARALAVQAELIVCSESTSALDVSVQAQILDLLRELQRRLGVSSLFITHNIGVVEYLADDIVVMQRGRLVESGPASQVLDRPAHAYTRTLLEAVPRIAGRSRAELRNDRAAFAAPAKPPAVRGS